MKLIAQNTTGNVATLRILDDAGVPRTGVAYNAAGLAVWYIPEGGTPVQITLTSGNWTETKFGEYEVDVPDAAYQTVQTVRIVGSLTDSVVIPDRHQVFSSLWTSLPSAGTIATAVVERAVSNSQPAGSLGNVLDSLNERIPDTLVDGRIKSVISESQVVDVGNQIVLASIQINPGDVAERSIEDNKPLTFSWPNNTDTVTGEVSIDNGSYVAVAGTISYLREENGKYYYTLAFNAADRPSEEGTARYKFTSGSYTMYATLRTVQYPLTTGIGEHQITLVADSTGGQVPGVVFRIVDTVLNVTTGSDGEVIINLDAGTYTLRTVAPPGYESVADQSLVVTDDATVTTTLTAIPVVPSVIQGAPSASLALRPAMDRKTPLLTLASVVDHLLLLDEINPAESRAVERASKAAKDALSSFASYSHQGFRYYESRAKIIMPGTVSLGTITVSDGSFTMAGDFTIPSWATLGHVRIDRNANKVYPVLLVNGQVITVDNAIEDGTYSNVYLEQLFYPLPRNFRRRGTLSDGKNNYPVEDMSGGSFQSFQDYYRWIGFSEFDRRFSAITMDQRNQGDLMLSVWPPFSDRVELSMFFERYPEALKHHRVGNSSATLSVSGSTATSTHAIFNENHVGAALTVGINSDQELIKSLASESLVDTQRIIRYVSSSTQVILDTPFSSPVSSRSFYVSDIVDVQPGIMTEAYKRLAEYELLRQTKGSKADKKLQEFVAALQMAQSDDARYKQSVDPFASPVGGVQWGEVRGRP